MKKLLRWLGVLLLAAIALGVGSLAYSTAKGYLRWYFRVNGEVTVNGRSTSGYMHANTDKTLLVLTRTDDSQLESYLISLGPEKAMIDCGQWHPRRFLPFVVGDVNPPCTALGDGTSPRDPPIAATLTRGRSFVEFYTSSGKKVRGQW